MCSSLISSQLEQSRFMSFGNYFENKIYIFPFLNGCSVFIELSNAQVESAAVTVVAT